jgi:hypothetical protein
MSKHVVLSLEGVVCATPYTCLPLRQAVAPPAQSTGGPTGVPVCTMKAYVEAVLTSALDGGGWLASRSSQLISR